MKALNIFASILTLSLLLLAGCAQSPQRVWLDPKLNVPTSSVGEGRVVAVDVVDRRPSPSLGNFGKSRDAATDLSTEQDVALVVKQEVISGMRKKGFVAVEEQTNRDAKLNVEIQSLEYATSPNTWTGDVYIKSALKAVASKNGKTLEKMYRANFDKRVVVVPTATTNEQWINEALGDVLRQLLEDRELSFFLTN